MRQGLAFLFIAFCAASLLGQSIPSAHGNADTPSDRAARPNINESQIVAANTLAQSLPITDWLGPMAPLALSPFFGMAFLSGLSLYGPDWMADNALLNSSGVLKNQGLFVAFLMLTVLTSLPRFSKVSKPFAQAVDQLETYSVIIILMLVKWTSEFVPPDQESAATVVQLGFWSFTANTMLSIAMVINVIVINSVKFFFEVLVWLTPVPALDAAFEFANKGICGLLMALYAFSPTIATIANLTLLAVSTLVFQWVHRRARFYRAMVGDPILTRLWPALSKFSPETGITVFAKNGIGQFAAKSKLCLAKCEPGWVLRKQGLFGTKILQLGHSVSPTLHLGWVMHSIDLEIDGQTHVVNISRRYDKRMDQLIDRLGFRTGETNQAEPVDHQQFAGEFA